MAESVQHADLIIWNLVAFFLMLFIMKFVVWPKLYIFIVKRQKKISDLLRIYNKQNEEVAKLVERMKNENEEAIKRRNIFLSEAKIESKKLRDEMIQKAYLESNVIVEQAKIEIQNEKRKATLEVRKNTSKIVSKALEVILGNTIDEELDRKILEETEKAVRIIDQE
ncbi:MAG: hypothetical protein A2Y40_02490 [Candidatus Margulisbacteria bacterium GWF2_35_9]|nr:MAG: hypothetical protein A2Y40_02490 [Candidatus Margulisbacteria bacterium GWF2_35_9]